MRISWSTSSGSDIGHQLLPDLCGVLGQGRSIGGALRHKYRPVVSIGGAINRRVLGTHVHRGGWYEKSLRPNTGCILESVELKVRKRHKLRIPIIVLTVLWSCPVNQTDLTVLNFSSIRFRTVRVNHYARDQK
jgi:hypothetical protein